MAMTESPQKSCFADLGVVIAAMRMEASPPDFTGSACMEAVGGAAVGGGAATASSSQPPPSSSSWSPRTSAPASACRTARLEDCDNDNFVRLANWAIAHANVCSLEFQA